jgi:hypothetical protein
MEHDQGFRPANRFLTTDEVALLRHLVSRGPHAEPRFAEQLGRLRVVGECSCGCPTIDLGLDGGPKQLDGPLLIVADLVGKSPEGIDINVILHAHSGVLSELEVYSVSGSEPFTLPRPGDLKEWEDAAV